MAKAAKPIRAKRALPRKPPAVIDWMAVRIAYERTNDLVKDIAGRFGVSVVLIGKMRKAHGWVGRKERHLLADTGPPGPLTNLLVLKERLRLIVEGKLDVIEQEAAKPEGEGRDTERQERLAAAMLRSHDRLEQVSSKAAIVRASLNMPVAGKANAATTQASSEADDDDERWRIEIAERIERLRQTWENG